MIKKGSVDQSIVLLILNTDGTPKTDVTSASAGLSISFFRGPGIGTTALTTISDLSNVNSAHSDGGIKHLGGGAYRVDPQDAAWATGTDKVTFFGAVTGGAIQKLDVYLTGIDLQDAVRGGLTALPNAAAGSPNGLHGDVLKAGTLPTQTGAAYTNGTFKLAASTFATDGDLNGKCIVFYASGVKVHSANVTASVASTQIVTVDGGIATPSIVASNTYEVLDGPGPIAGLSNAQINYLRKNVAPTAFLFKMIDSTDRVSGKTGLTVTFNRSIDGAAFASAGGAVTERSNGWYQYAPVQADFNGDSVVLRFTGTGALPTEMQFFLQPT